MGRPSSYTDEIADEICKRLAAGEALTDMCANDPRFPHRTTVARWVRENAAFATEYARARDMAGDAEFDKHAEVIRDLAEGKIEPDTARVMLNGIQWRAKVLSPRYQDKVHQEHTGKDGGPIEFKDVRWADQTTPS